MQTEIQDLGGLQRRIDLTVTSSDVAAEVSQRLAQMARQASLPGFRRGKVPMKMVAASYASQIQAEVMREKLGQALSSALDAGKLRLAGAPRLEPKPASGAGDISFCATFEVYPEVDPGDLSELAIPRYACSVAESDVDATIEIIRRQRAKHQLVERGAADGDRVTVDFHGTIDGQAFEGGEAKDFAFNLGQGRMLPAFEQAVRTLRGGEEATFPLSFPADYPARKLAGVAAEFSLQVKRVEQTELPPVDQEFARALGAADGDLARMRADLRANLEREVQSRLKARTRDAVLGALIQSARFEVPQSLVDEELERLTQAGPQGTAGANPAEPPGEALQEAARQRVRLGLLMGELIGRHNLQPRQDQVRKAVESIAQSYQNPAEVIQWYLGDRERVAQLEATLAQDNVVAWVVQHAKVADVAVSFDELMGARN